MSPSFPQWFLEVPSIETVPDAACYFPLANGRYEVKPGLMPLGMDLGNGEDDRRVFQLDGSFADYRRVKLQARAERLEKYYQICNYSPNLAAAVVRWMVDRLSREYPQCFSQSTTDDGFTLDCDLTGERLCFSSQGALQAVESCRGVPAYGSALDALANQVQEDLTVICRAPDGNQWLSAVHLCFPNHWSAEEKVGKDFATIHAPVAGMEKMNQRSAAIVHTMVTCAPMVRFAWGLSTDTRLNHHPEPPPGVAEADWQGRQFDLHHPRLFLRIERQVIWGLPEQDGAIFTIRTYFRDCQRIKQDRGLRSSLISALESMTPESLVYKGLHHCKAAILTWLTQG